MDRFDHHFTEDEARALLAELLPTIEELMNIRNRIVELRPELESGLEKALGNGGSQANRGTLKLDEPRQCASCTYPGIGGADQGP